MHILFGVFHCGSFLIAHSTDAVNAVAGAKVLSAPQNQLYVTCPHACKGTLDRTIRRQYSI